MRIEFFKNTDVYQNSSVQNSNIESFSLSSIWKVKGNEKVGQTEKADKELSAKDAEKSEKLKNIFQKGNKILSDKTLKKNCEKLQHANFPVFLSLGLVFDSERKELAKDAVKVMSSISEAMQDPSSVSDSQLEDFVNQMNKISSRFKNLKSKSEKSIELDKKLKEFEAKGGDVDSINMDKINEDILSSLENENEAEVSDSGSVEEKSAENASDMSDESKEIDEKLESFMKILDSEDPQKISEAKHDYIENKDKGEKKVNEESKSSINPFSAQKTKKYFDV